METFLWILSHFSARISIILLGIADGYILNKYFEKGILQKSIFANETFVIVVISIVLAFCIYMAFLGGKAGHDHIELIRSRQWHYRSTKLSAYDNKFSNVLYWAGKFACLPIVILLFAIFVWAVWVFLKINNVL